MSTVEEIEEAIAKLPPEEFSEIYAWISERAETSATPEVRYMDEATFKASSKKVFRHYAPLLKKLAE